MQCKIIFNKLTKRQFNLKSYLNELRELKLQLKTTEPRQQRLEQVPVYHRIITVQARRIK